MTTEKKQALVWDFGKMLIAAILAVAGFYAKLSSDNAVRDVRMNTLLDQVARLNQKVFIERTDEMNCLSKSQALMSQKVESLETTNTAQHVELKLGQAEIKQILRDHAEAKVTKLSLATPEEN
jgi:hypothetical protein